MKARKTGFTLVEMLTVITVIAILVGLLVPAVTAVRGMARNTQARAQINTLGLAIGAFKNDNGDYPWSNREGQRNNLANRDYSGAQMLSEGLLGWDLMGFHPDSEWREDGKYQGNKELYEVAVNGTPQEQQDNLRRRRGPYLERAKTSVARLDELFESQAPNPMTLEGDKTFVICDTFNFRKITDKVTGERERVGSPILYYKADRRRKVLDRDDAKISIYDAYDNWQVIAVKGKEDGKLAGTTAAKKHEWLDLDKFYGDEPNYEHSIRDPKTSKKYPWPYRPDSYILISAGADGEYGTIDDITNFK